MKKFIDHSMENRKLGEVVSDAVASGVGSWKFIITQSVIIFMWIIINVNLPINGIDMGNFTLKPWDPYPFIFLNLALSFQAAYTAPIIMMSQNRQSVIDRKRAEADYEINKLAENEIEFIQSELAEIKSHVTNTSLINQDLKKVKDQLEILKALLEGRN